VPLAGWRGEEDFVGWNGAPISLVEILADVLCLGVIGGVNLTRYRPVISGPDNPDPSHAGARRKSSRSGE
jgi:hypothetical protein